MKAFKITIFFVLVLLCNNASLSSQKISIEDQLTLLFDSVAKIKCEHVTTERKIPGFLVSVKSKNINYEKAFLYSGGISEPITINMGFRIGSITKTFTLTVLLQLVDEKKLGLDDPLSNFFPEFPNGKNITVRMLGNMTSGIYDYTLDEVRFVQVMEKQPYKRWTNQELVNIAKQHNPKFAPGDSFNYSNTNTILLGMIIEKLTNNTLAEEINDRISVPLGLKNTYIPMDSALSAPYSKGHVTEITGCNVDVTNAFDPSWAGAAGIIVSNLHDMNIYIKALGSGILISKESQKERLQWVYKDPAGIFKYGLGIFELRGGFLGHNGGIPGYSDVAVYSPEKDCSIIFMSNMYMEDPAFTNSIASRVIDILYGK